MADFSQPTSRPKLVFSPDLALSTCFKDPEVVSKLLIGGAINALAAILLVWNPVFLPVCLCLYSLVVGYVLGTMRKHCNDLRAVSKEPTLKPSLEEWRSPFDLMIPGMSWLAVALGHLLFVFMLASFCFALGAVRGSLYALSSEYGIWVVLTLTIVTTTALLTSFYSSYLMTNFAVSGRMLAAFDLVAAHKRIAACPLQAVQAWLLSLGLHWIAVLVPLCSIIGVFFLPLTLFGAQVTSGLLFAQIWALSED